MRDVNIVLFPHSFYNRGKRDISLSIILILSVYKPVHFIFKGVPAMMTIYKLSDHPTVDFAAEELKKYLRMLQPLCGEILICRQDSANISELSQSGFCLLLDPDHAVMSDQIPCPKLPDSYTPALDDVIRILTSACGGVIIGSNPTALLIGVYRYLKELGCRFLFPGIDGEQIPMLDGDLPAVRYAKAASYRYRGHCNEGGQSQKDILEAIDFAPKIGLNTFMIEFDNPYYYYVSYYEHRLNPERPNEAVTRDNVLQWKRQCEAEIAKRSLKFHDMGHGWTCEPFGIDSRYGWIPVSEDKVPAESRQYLAMIGGERKLYHGVPLNTNICLSNPEARQKIAKYVADYAQRQSNVDFLHIWLADANNNHCECENCRKKDVADWYVMLLNEIDEELTQRALKTHLVFIAYIDTFWKPQEERLKHQERFTLLYAPITRLYTESYLLPSDPSALVPYKRNHNVFPRGMSECLAYLDAWKEDWKGDCFCYEYHFWLHQYCDPAVLYFSRRIYEDIQGLKRHGLMGIVEDGSQRSYYPNGFNNYVYGETLFDDSVSYEALLEDYFSHAYGKDWQKVIDFFKDVSPILDFAYLSGLKSIDPERGKFYDPSMKGKAAALPALLESFRPVVEANIPQPTRAGTVTWQLLRLHLTTLGFYGRLVEAKSVGHDEEARKIAEELMRFLGRNEVYYETCFDQYMFMHAIERLVGKLG